MNDRELFETIQNFIFLISKIFKISLLSFGVFKKFFLSEILYEFMTLLIIFEYIFFGINFLKKEIV